MEDSHFCIYGRSVDLYGFEGRVTAVGLQRLDKKAEKRLVVVGDSLFVLDGADFCKIQLTTFVQFR